MIPLTSGAPGAFTSPQAKAPMVGEELRQSSTNTTGNPSSLATHAVEKSPWGFKPSYSPITPSTRAMSAPSEACLYTQGRRPGVRNPSKFQHSRPEAAERYEGSM